MEPRPLSLHYFISGGGAAKLPASARHRRFLPTASAATALQHCRATAVQCLCGSAGRHYTAVQQYSSTYELYCTTASAGCRTACYSARTGTERQSLLQYYYCRASTVLYSTTTVVVGAGQEPVLPVPPTALARQKVLSAVPLPTAVLTLSTA